MPAATVGAIVDGSAQKTAFLGKLESLEVEADNIAITVPGAMANTLRSPFATTLLLDALVIRPIRITGTAANDAKWLVWCNANGVIYEQILEFVAKYATRIGCNAVVFNYRGVSGSNGWPSSADDLGKDTAAVVAHVIEVYGAREENVLIHAHSIGGGAMAAAVTRYPQVKRISDRSFRSLSATVGTMMGTGLGNLMAYVPPRPR